MIPGFENEFIGKKVGDEVNFPITFPKDYHAEEFAGNEYYFACSIDSIDVATVPSLDDPEFLAKIAGD